MKMFFSVLLASTLILSACTQGNSVSGTASPKVQLHDSNTKIEFTIKIENLSDKTALSTPFASGLWVLAAPKSERVLFLDGEQVSAGLEQLAEDGDPTALKVELEKNVADYPAIGLLDAIKPGESQVFKIVASPGQKLSFASMLAQTNDLFLAPISGGLALFDEQNEPISGDLSQKMVIWDAGTEKNQEPGKGTDQAPRQLSSNTGQPEKSVLQNLQDNQPVFVYPMVGTLIKVSMTNNDSHS